MYKYSAVLWFSLTEEDFIIETYFINSCVFMIIMIIIIRAIFIQGNLVNTISIVINKGPVSTLKKSNLSIFNVKI